MIVYIQRTLLKSSMSGIFQCDNSSQNEIRFQLFRFLVGFQDRESRPGLKSALEADDYLYNISICVLRRLLRYHLDPSERLLPHSVPSFLSCRGITQLLSVFKSISRISRRREARWKMLQHILLSTQILEKMRLSDGLAHIEEQRKKKLYGSQSIIPCRLDLTKGNVTYICDRNP